MGKNPSLSGDFTKGRLNTCLCVGLIILFTSVFAFRDERLRDERLRDERLSDERLSDERLRDERLRDERLRDEFRR